MTEPTVQRVGSGRSARVSALVAVLLIAVVAWFGFAGRDARPPESSLPPVADASPSAPPASADPTPTPGRSARPRPTPRPTPADAFEGQSEYSYAIFMSIGNRPYFTTLSERAKDVLSADVRVTLPLAAPVAALNIVLQWSTEADSGLLPVLATALPVDVLLDDSAQIMVVPGRQAEEGSPRLIRDGYMLTVSGETREAMAVVHIDLRVGGVPSLPRPADGQVPTLSEGFFEASLTRGRRQLTILRIDGTSDGSFQGFAPLPAAWRAEQSTLRIAWSDGRATNQRAVLASLELEPEILDATGDQLLIDEVVRLERRIDGVRRWHYRVELQDHGPALALLAIEIRPETALMPGAPAGAAWSGSQPRLEARLQNEGRLTARVGLGGAPPGVLTAHVIAHERDGAAPVLELVSVDGVSAQLLASQGLQMRDLRRGHPEELVGFFTLSSAGDEGQTWRYRITPHGTGSGVMLLVEAEPLADVPLTCWSNGDLC